MNAGLPAGTITFLFTDIEGSTLRWEREPDAMQSAVALHDTVVKGAIETHGGVVFKTVGDAFCAAFDRAPNAFAAALAVQRGLATGDRQPAGPPRQARDFQLRVRVALHTGTAETRDGDYFGPALNRVARLLAAGHGGQILLSQAAYDLVRDRLPDDVTVRDLGEHRLRDLSRPERIFQVVAPDLPDDFPAPRTLDIRPNNLPLPSTRLIGRDRQIAEARQRLLNGDARLLSLTGPAGTGKTRLALELAATLLDEFPEGVFFIDLSPLDDPELVVPSIAQTLGIREASDQPLLERLKDYLRDKRLLLVLDNFEHVLTAALAVADLLAACSGLSVLTTSRAPLQVHWEYEYPVPPLALPDLRQLPPLDRLAAYEAVQLFVARAQAIDPAFNLGDDNARVIAEICSRLDGLPLAIELAAARVRLFSPDALLVRLSRTTAAPSLQLLSGGARDLPARHQTLRAALAWSYDLLSADEQTLFARLAVFAGGCTFDAAEAVCINSGGITLDLVDGLTSLVSKNLLRRDEEAHPGLPGRFRMLETMREYAWERLVAGGATEATRRWHAAHFRALAEQAEIELSGPQRGMWWEQLEREHDNLRAALRWSIASGDAEDGLRLAGALWQFWWMRGYLTEGRAWLAQLLALPASVSARARAKALRAGGLLAVWQGDYGPARPLLEESLADCRAAGDECGAAHALMWLGRAARDQGDEAAAGATTEESISLLRDTDDRWGLALALHFHGLAVEPNDTAAARACFEESAALFREMGDRHGLAMPTRGLGIVAYRDGDDAAARAYFEESAALFREMGDEWSVAMALHDLGNVALRQRDLPRAAADFGESLTLWRKVGNMRGHALCLAGLAGVAACAGESERAARLFGAAEAVRTATGAVLEPTDRADYEPNVAAARAALDDASFAASWTAGRSMPLEQAIADALTIDWSAATAASEMERPAVSAALAGLTAREREVAALLARGLSNRQIGEALVITEGTAGLHVKHILSKLNLSSRARVAAWAVEHGLHTTT